MLKKLVRYGNSNALVLDKAILELLNISEGSVVKIKTDGQSIIITPHQETSSTKVIPTITSHDAMHDAALLESMKYYKNIPEEQRKELGKQLSALMTKQGELMSELCADETFQGQVAQAKTLCGQDHTKFMQVYNNLRDAYSPKVAANQKTIDDLLAKCSTLNGDNVVEEQSKQETMKHDFAAVFAKHKDIQLDFGQVLNSAEYQHRAQLITEKYQGNQNSAEFMQEMKNVMYEFCPEMRQIHADIEAVGAKYYPKNS